MFVQKTIDNGRGNTCFWTGKCKIVFPRMTRLFRGADVQTICAFQFPNTLKRVKIVQSKICNIAAPAAIALCLDT